MICCRGRTSCLTFAKRKFEIFWSRFWLRLYFCLTTVVERLPFLCGKQRCLDIFENHEYNNNRIENKKHETVNGGQYGNII